MPKFSIQICSEHVGTIEIDADSEQAALDKAQEAVQNEHSWEGIFGMLALLKVDGAVVKDVMEFKTLRLQ